MALRQLPFALAAGGTALLFGGLLYVLADELLLPGGTHRAAARALAAARADSRLLRALGARDLAMCPGVRPSAAATGKTRDVRVCVCSASNAARRAVLHIRMVQHSALAVEDTLVEAHVDGRPIRLLPKEEPRPHRLAFFGRSK